MTEGIHLDPVPWLIIGGLIFALASGFLMQDPLFLTREKHSVLKDYETVGVSVEGSIGRHTLKREYMRIPLCCFQSAVEYTAYYSYRDPETAEPLERLYYEEDWGCWAGISPMETPCSVIVLPGIRTSGILQKRLDQKETGALAIAKKLAFLGSSLFLGSAMFASGLLEDGSPFVVPITFAAAVVSFCLFLPCRKRMLRMWKRSLMEDTTSGGALLRGDGEDYHRGEQRNSVEKSGKATPSRREETVELTSTIAASPSGLV